MPGTAAGCLPIWRKPQRKANARGPHQALSLVQSQARCFPFGVRRFAAALVLAFFRRKLHGAKKGKIKRRKSAALQEASTPKVTKTGRLLLHQGRVGPLCKYAEEATTREQFC